MRVELERAPKGARSILRNLLQLYFHDLSEFMPRPVDSQGLYQYDDFECYWTEDGHYPFLIRVDGSLAGFAFVRFDDEGTANMAEFFVMRSHRRRGVGSIAAQELFDMFKSDWQVRQEATNHAAHEFWLPVVASYTGGDFEDFLLGDDLWRVQRFKSRARRKSPSGGAG